VPSVDASNRTGMMLKNLISGLFSTWNSNPYGSAQRGHTSNPVIRLF